MIGKREEGAAASGSLTLDVGVNLDNGITVHGRGLDAQLIGDLQFSSSVTEGLRARGTLRMDKGSFTAYGRALSIEQGVLRFDGAVNNPALDILAMRRGPGVEAGVWVHGTVLSPRIALVSEPTVPDAEKPSRVVLGRGLDAVAGGDLGTLQSATASLLSQGAASGVQPVGCSQILQLPLAWTTSSSVPTQTICNNASSRSASRFHHASMSVTSRACKPPPVSSTGATRCPRSCRSKSKSKPVPAAPCRCSTT